GAKTGRRRKNRRRAQPGAAFFAEPGLSDPAMRPTRSVTTSPQAPDRSLCRLTDTAYPLRVLRWASAGAPHLLQTSAHVWAAAMYLGPTDRCRQSRVGPPYMAAAAHLVG